MKEKLTFTEIIICLAYVSSSILVSYSQFIVYSQ